MTEEIIKKLDDSVVSVIGNKALQGFHKANAIANAIVELKSLLTPEYMKPIMALQGSKLGFRTDKDKSGGYSMDVVRNCLIEAVLIGLQPTGNQFNIIAGNTYPTKEGCGYLLNNFDGLKYDLVCSLPKINNDKTSAAVDVTINWSLNGITKEKTIPIPIKIDQYASVDSIIGKATRKGRAWLLGTITGVEVTDGEVEDSLAKVIESKPIKTKEESENERMIALLSDCKTIMEIDDLQIKNPDFDIQLFINRKKEINECK